MFRTMCVKNKPLTSLAMWSRWSGAGRFSTEAASTASESSANPRSPPPPLDIPQAAGAEKNYPPKIRSLVDEIAKLNLLEVADLNECLKKTLKIESVPMAMSPGMFAAPPQATKSEDGEGDQAAVKAKSTFTVKLIKFDDSKKVALIKEVKGLVEGMNLVQAKKFVESVPQVLKTNVPKDEAEKMQKALEALGAIVEIE